LRAGGKHADSIAEVLVDDLGDLLAKEVVWDAVNELIDGVIVGGLYAH